MLQREQGKDKALRIDLAYHRQRTWLDVARFVAVGVALLLSTAYAMWILVLAETKLDLPKGSRAAQLSTGPLALVHASFENDCQQCHADTTGLGLARDGWLSDETERLKLLEEKCQNCHLVGQHAREKLAQPELDRDCSRCHIDHQGRQHDLATVTDRVCAECHADLRLVCKTGVSPRFIDSIADFSVRSHGIVPPPVGDSTPSPPPQFRSLLKDPGRVRFDHAQHLRPGQVDPNSKGGFRLSMLTPIRREAYRRPGDNDDSLVQLDCASCHQPFTLKSSDSKYQPDTGAYYAPIDFETHCVACHQITFPGQDLNDLPLPHVAQRQEFAKLIAAKENIGRLGGKLLTAGDQEFATEPATKLGLPDQPDALLRSKLDEAVSAVFVRCQQCHFEPDLEPETIAQALAGSLPPLISQRWFEHSFFNHAAHASIERCGYCHPIPTPQGPAQDQQHVLIRGPASCVACHRSADLPTPAEIDTADKRLAELGTIRQPTWASAQCTTCHRYHAELHGNPNSVRGTSRSTSPIPGQVSP